MALRLHVVNCDRETTSGRSDGTLVIAHCRAAATGEIVDGLSFSLPCHAVQRVQRYLPLSRRRSRRLRLRLESSRVESSHAVRLDGQWMDGWMQSCARAQLHNGLTRTNSRSTGNEWTYLHGPKSRRCFRPSWSKSGNAEKKVEAPLRDNARTDKQSSRMYLAYLDKATNSRLGIIFDATRQPKAC